MKKKLKILFYSNTRITATSWTAFKPCRAIWIWWAWRLIERTRS